MNTGNQIKIAWVVTLDMQYSGFYVTYSFKNR